MALKDDELQDPTGNAPQRARGLLFPLGIASLLLGLLFVLFWFLMGLASDLPDFTTTEVETRRWVLIAVGSFLTLQGLALLVVRFAGSKSLGAGAARNMLVLNVVLMIALCTVLFVLVNYIFARHELWRVDLTTQSLHTLSEESVTLVETLPAKTKLVLLMPGGEDAAQLERLITQYQAATSMLIIERHNPRTMEREEFRAILDGLDLSADTPEGELLGVVVQSGEEKDGAWVKGRSKHIGWRTLWRRDMSDPSTPRMAFYGEQLISSAIREVVNAEPPKIYFLSGHGEQSIEDFDQRKSISRMVKILRERQLDVLKLNLIDREEVDVPEDCRLLVVPAPRRALTAFELKSLQAYLERGGRAVFFVEPLFRKGPGGDAIFDETGLEGLISQTYGIESLDEIIFLKFQNERKLQEGKPLLYLQDLAIDHKITNLLALQSARISFYTARPLTTRPVVGVETKELVTTKGWGPRCFSSFNPTAAQTPSMMREGPFAVAIAAERQPAGGSSEEASRVLVFGDVDWLSNQMMSNRAYANQELLLNSVNWLMHRDDLIVGKAHRPPDNKLTMTQGTLTRLKALACPGMPAIALALGLFAWMIRSRT